MTFIAILVTVPVALGVGLAVGRRRGPVVGVASGAGVVAAGALGYFALLALTLPM